MPLPDLTDKEAVKAYCAVSEDGENDEVIVDLVTACSAWVRSYLNRDITTSSYDIRRSGRGTFALLLPQYPVQSVELLEINGQAVTAQTSWGSSGYRFDDEQIVVDGYAFIRGVSNIHVQFTAGFDVVPDDLAQAVNELVALRYKLRDKVEWSSQTMAGMTSTLVTKDMPASVKTVLDSYRRMVPL